MDLNMVQKIKQLNNKIESYRTRQIVLLVLDILIILVSYLLSSKLTGVNFKAGILLYSLINIFFYYKFNCYSSLWSLGGERELTNVFMAGGISGICFIAISNLIGNGLDILFYIINILFVIVLTMGSRLIYRGIRRMLSYMSINNTKGVSRILIIGAGSAGKLIVREIYENTNLNKLPVAIVDDDLKKIGKSIYNIPIVGRCEDIPMLVNEYDIDEIIFSIANIPKDKKSNILEYCNKTKCKIKTIPGIYELIEGKVDIKEIRDVQIEDLLGRDVIETDMKQISKYLENKIALVTGGGGSIGSEICRQIAKFKPKKLIIFDIYENNAYDVQQELTRTYGNSLDLEVIIGSVRDESRIDDIMSTYYPDVVFHAAAHKHVPLMENSPCEAIKNNIFGTLNVAKKASEYKVKKFVLISTDKAVNPTNIMGATKRCCEMIIQSLNKHSKTEFVAVRFGNVLGSNGSVIPLFKKQIEEGGPVRVTHPQITRYFMTIPEAVSLVIEAGSMAEGGEIFVLDMGKPVKISDLAKKLIKLSGLEPNVDIKIQYTGLRPGEKLYEELLIGGKGLRSTNNKKIFVEKPININEYQLWEELRILNKCAEINDITRVKSLIKEIVPTYIEEKEVEAEKESLAVSI